MFSAENGRHHYEYIQRHHISRRYERTERLEECIPRYAWCQPQHSKRAHGSRRT